MLVVVSASTQIDSHRLADAIYRAEGGNRARTPYGVLSVKTKDARKVTLNSIQNNHARWEKAGRPCSFIRYMGRRWCPPSADPVGHKNWVRNVTKIYHQKKKG